MPKGKNCRRPAPSFSFGGIGDQFGHQLGVFKARLASHARKKKIDEVADHVGADLIDPEEFRIIEELVDKTS
ncbi:MAG: hypothetical protein Q8O88_01920 [bacterium]|nr:hypothetical protein [bacterium]